MKLFAALGVLLLAVMAIARPDNASTSLAAPVQPTIETTTAVPISNSTIPAASTTTNSTVTNTTTATPITSSTSSTSVTTSKPSTPKSTTTVKPTVPSPTSPTPTEPTKHPGSTTTAIPPMSTPTPSKGTHGFDGLSFMAGIVVTTCVVGMVVGSLKFYKIRTDRSYRTL